MYIYPVCTAIRQYASIKLVSCTHSHSLSALTHSLTHSHSNSHSLRDLCQGPVHKTPKHHAGMPSDEPAVNGMWQATGETSDRHPLPLVTYSAADGGPSMSSANNPCMLVHAAVIISSTRLALQPAASPCHWPVTVNTARGICTQCTPPHGNANKNNIKHAPAYYSLHLILIQDSATYSVYYILVLRTRSSPYGNRHGICIRKKGGSDPANQPPGL